MFAVVKLRLSRPPTRADAEGLTNRQTRYQSEDSHYEVIHIISVWMIIKSFVNRDINTISRTFAPSLLVLLRSLVASVATATEQRRVAT